jgi:putative PIG3 family NAD(P)H quinone oxidoreductase
MALEIPGLEFAGTVTGTGARVVEVAVGDPVMGIVAGGAYATSVVTHERTLMAVPESVSVEDAAAIPEAFVTAFDALVAQGGLAPGGTALVHAGGSGVGTAAIQIARSIGARVVVTASAGKLDACRALGADVAVDYAADDFVEAVRDLTGGAGADVILDVIGGDYVNRNIAASAVGGRIIQVGVMGGGSAKVSVGLLLVKKIHLVGTTLRSRPLEEKIAISRRVAAEVLPGFDAGVLRPVIDSRFRFDGVADAHRHMESNANVGKILLDVET